MKNLARHYATGGGADDLAPRKNLPKQGSPTGTRPSGQTKIPLEVIEQQMGETKEGKPIPKASGGPIYSRGAKVKSRSEHVDHAKHVKQHAAGFMHHDDHVKKLCGGGYMGKK